MKTIRIIPRLDIKGPNLVKGIHLEGLRVLGTPEDFAEYYYKQGADELFYQDVVASLYERNSLSDIISRTAKKAFIPLTVGGGIRSIQNIKDVLRAGADKVAINTAAIKEPDLIKRASREFGASTIVVAIEAIKMGEGNYEAFIDNGREQTGVDVLQWAKRVEELGAGEIVITSIDKEGTGEGFDLDLIRRISTSVNIPVIAHGGMGKIDDALLAIRDAKADALAISSVLHYGFVEEYRNLNISKTEGNIQFLKSGRGYSKIKRLTLSEIKNYLQDNKIDCRNI